MQFPVFLQTLTRGQELASRGKTWSFQGLRKKKKQTCRNRKKTTVSGTGDYPHGLFFWHCKTSRLPFLHFFMWFNGTKTKAQLSNPQPYDIYLTNHLKIARTSAIFQCISDLYRTGSKSSKGYWSIIVWPTQGSRVTDPSFRVSKLSETINIRNHKNYS